MQDPVCLQRAGWSNFFQSALSVAHPAAQPDDCRSGNELQLGFGSE